MFKFRKGAQDLGYLPGYYSNHYSRSDGSHVGVHMFALYPSVIDINKKKYRTQKPYTIEFD